VCYVSDPLLIIFSSSLPLLEFPTFLDYFKQIRQADAPYASKCAAHWRLFMRGPPNRPNEDEYGLIEVGIPIGLLL
jgi:hypothetical protein